MVLNSKVNVLLRALSIILRSVTQHSFKGWASFDLQVVGLGGKQ